MQPLILSEFQYRHDKAMQTIARMKVDLDSYAARPDANAQAVDIRTEILNNLLDYLTYADEAVKEIGEEWQAYGNRRFAQGYADGFDSATMKPGPEDKEALRSYHKIATFQKWQDHY